MPIALQVPPVPNTSLQARRPYRGDGRNRRWCQVPEMEDRYLRVILLADGETVHNALSTEDLPHESPVLRRHGHAVYRIS
jgi:hypothetical protein